MVSTGYRYRIAKPSAGIVHWSAYTVGLNGQVSGRLRSLWCKAPALYGKSSAPAGACPTPHRAGKIRRRCFKGVDVRGSIPQCEAPKHLYDDEPQCSCKGCIAPPVTAPISSDMGKARFPRIEWQNRKILLSPRFFYHASGGQTSSQRCRATGNQGLSCSPRLRPRVRTYATVGGCCGSHFPVLRLFQASLRA